MANKNLRAGTLSFMRNGEILDAVGNFDYSLGTPKREAIVGADRVHGYKEMPQVAYIEGEVTDRSDLDLRALFLGESDTLTLRLRNGKTILLRQAWYAGDAKVSSESGAIQVRFEGMSGEEVTA